MALRFVYENGVTTRDAYHADGQLARFAAAYGIDGFKWDAGDVGPMERTLRFHDPARRAVDWAHDYVRGRGHGGRRALTIARLMGYTSTP